MRSATVTASLLLALAACGGSDDGPTGPSANIEGTYTLQTVNGSSPPVVIYQDATGRIEMMSGSITVNSGNTFSDVITLRVTTSGNVLTQTATCTGTYIRNGNSVTFTEANTSQCGGSFNGTWANGTTLTVALDATVQAVFRK